MDGRHDYLDQFELTDGERMHPLWMRLKGHLETQLQSTRARNDNAKLSEAETAALRGHIQCLIAIAAIGNEPPPQVVPGDRHRARVDLGAKYG